MFFYIIHGSNGPIFNRIYIFIQVPFSTQLGYFTQMYLRKNLNKLLSVQQKIWIHLKKTHIQNSSSCFDIFLNTQKKARNLGRDSFFNASNPLRTHNFPLESQAFSLRENSHLPTSRGMNQNIPSTAPKKSHLVCRC